MFHCTLRPIKLRLCSAYRTVSNSCLDVISGTPPVHLLIDLRDHLRLTERNAPKKIFQCIYYILLYTRVLLSAIDQDSGFVKMH